MNEVLLYVKVQPERKSHAVAVPALDQDIRDLEGAEDELLQELESHSSTLMN